jgi:hypothetical protein
MANFPRTAERCQQSDPASSQNGAVSIGFLTETHWQEGSKLFLNLDNGANDETSHEST